VITDIKHIDDDKHKLYTGVGNKLILDNIIRTVELDKKLVLRLPIIPDHNDDKAAVMAAGEFIRDKLKNKVIQVQLIPYRKMGVDKYDSLNISYPLGNDYVPPGREVWEQKLLYLAGLLTDMGIPAVAGSNVKYKA
jgi:pyruvate formate lyase activating enzyme